MRKESGWRVIGASEAEALNSFKMKASTILTRNQEDTIKKDGVTLKIMPVWKWLRRISILAVKLCNMSTC